MILDGHYTSGEDVALAEFRVRLDELDTHAHDIGGKAAALRLTEIVDDYLTALFPDIENEHGVAESAFGRPATGSIVTSIDLIEQKDE